MSLEDVTNDILNDNILPGGEDDEEDNENPFGTNENEDGEGIKVEPKATKKVVRPRQRLTEENLTGKRGIHTIENYFKDIKFKGKDHRLTKHSFIKTSNRQRPRKNRLERSDEANAALGS